MGSTLIYPTQLCILHWIWFGMNDVIQGWRSHDKGLLPDQKPLAQSEKPCQGTLKELARSRRGAKREQI